MDTVAKRKLNGLRQRAQAGSAPAQWELGYYHENGAEDALGRVLLEPDRRAARRWYALAAEQGDAGGQLALSNLLSS